MTRQRVPDHYEPPTLELWVAAAAFLLGFVMAVLIWLERVSR